MKKKRNQKKYWKKVAKSYAGLVGEIGDLAHNKVINPIVSKFLGDLKGKATLDAGCGNGCWSRKMAKKAKSTVRNQYPIILISSGNFSILPQLLLINK